MAAATAANRFSTLPPAAARNIFARVPVKARARCAVVCPAWRDNVADTRLWLQLDLTADDDDEQHKRAAPRCTTETLLGAAARAGGQLQTLRLTCGYEGSDAWSAALCTVAAANAATLHELILLGPRFDCLEHLAPLLAAAPALRVLQSDVLCSSGAVARRALRNQPPFGPLRIRELSVHDAAGITRAMIALAADIAGHASVTCLELADGALREAAALAALVDAALVRRLTRVNLIECEDLPHAAPALARLLRGGAVTALGVNNYGSRMLDVPGATLRATRPAARRTARATTR
jgi:hypothetical protein